MKKLLTLIVVHQNNKVLLAMKKRGFGAGRWNGFGGKVQEDETIENAARREAKEEAEIIVGHLDERGIIEFEFQTKPGEILEVHIFKTEQFSGIPAETEEMKPEWFAVGKIPFKDMWSGDQYWFPIFLADKQFKGRFLFGENDTVLDWRLQEVSTLL
jgi:8-oxo-dGTP diphosphatase/2-hydroxy-dATP diphosphatase